MSNYYWNKAKIFPRTSLYLKKLDYSKIEKRLINQLLYSVGFVGFYLLELLLIYSNSEQTYSFINPAMFNVLWR